MCNGKGKHTCTTEGVGLLIKNIYQTEMNNITYRSSGILNLAKQFKNKILNRLSMYVSDISKPK